MSHKLLSELKGNKKNPRIIKKKEFEKLVRSLKRLPEGLLVNKIAYKINQDGNKEIVSGNQRVKALKILEAEGMKINDDWFVDVSGLSEEAIEELIISMNTHFGEWDWDEVANKWDGKPLEEWGMKVPKINKLEGVDYRYEISRNTHIMGIVWDNVVDEMWLKNIFGDKLPPIISINDFKEKWDENQKSQK